MRRECPFEGEGGAGEDKEKKSWSRGSSKTDLRTVSCREKRGLFAENGLKNEKQKTNLNQEGSGKMATSCRLPRAKGGRLGGKLRISVWEL